MALLQEESSNLYSTTLLSIQAYESLTSDLLIKSKKRQQTPCLKNQDLLFRLIIIKARN
jgi:hypothetical protein